MKAVTFAATETVYMKAMIFAAGLGTRFKPWTDKHPKALAVINSKSLLQRNIQYLQQFGITDIIVNVHHFAEQVTQVLEKNNGWGSKITISDETTELLETGGGLLKAKWFFDDGAFVVINADILTDLDLGKMIAYHNTNKPVATLAVTDRKTSRYFLFDEEDKLCGWINTKTGEEKISRKKKGLIQKAFSGIHIIDPGIFSLIKQQGKFSIVDTYLDIEKTGTIKG
ncbi:MAG: NTP transferase domain-containing protein, partial [Bacteroidetes bacterium]|nr:NTP transferase domain-containing protein [Bacteroidota bacterium]